MAAFARFTGPLADRITGRAVAEIVPRMEAEVAELGRSFGEHVRG